MAEKGVRVIDRDFDILELLFQEKGGLGITEISLFQNISKRLGFKNKMKRSFFND